MMHCIPLCCAVFYAMLLQVVVPQGVLVRASTQLTVTQALEIADMTLETSCRAIQWALNVPEVLLASAGVIGGCDLVGRLSGSRVIVLHLFPHTVFVTGNGKQEVRTP